MNENIYNQKLAAGDIQTVDPAVQEQVGGGETPIGLWGKLLPFVYGPIKRILKDYFNTLYPTGGVGAWTSWVPSWTGLTVGNGTLVAVYTQIGKTVHFRLKFTLGSTSSVSGVFAFSLPVNAKDSGLYAYNGFIHQPGISFFICLGLQVGNTIRIEVMAAGGTFAIPNDANVTVPMTWATGHEFFIRGTYEAV